jgi:hypothetical protein
MSEAWELAVHLALVYRLDKRARDIDRCSPDLKTLIAIACSGANGEPPSVNETARVRALRRLNKAVTVLNASRVANQ